MILDIEYWQYLELATQGDGKSENEVSEPLDEVGSCGFGLLPLLVGLGDQRLHF